MAGQKNSRSSESIAGAVLVGLGMFILYEHLAGAAARLSHVLGANGSGPLAVILAASQVLQAYAANHQRFVHSCLQHILVSSWPMLLVMAGTVLSRDAFADDVNALPKKDGELVDLTVHGSTLK
jgi:uncharacterized membrane protein